MNNVEFLIALANQLDEEGKYELADEVDENFQEFLQLLEEGKMDFDFTYNGGVRDPRGPYSNRGRQVCVWDVDGPQ